MVQKASQEQRWEKCQELASSQLPDRTLWWNVAYLKWANKNYPAKQGQNAVQQPTPMESLRVPISSKTCVGIHTPPTTKNDSILTRGFIDFFSALPNRCLWSKISSDRDSMVALNQFALVALTAGKSLLASSLSLTFFTYQSRTQKHIMPVCLQLSLMYLKKMIKSSPPHFSLI